MRLRAKFNLTLIAIFAFAAVAALYLARAQFERDAREDVTRQAGLIMEAALAVRAYTVAHTKPHLDPMLPEKWLPQTVPAFAATETIELLRKKYPNYSYREAVLNPTNPRDKALAWEAELVTRFRSDDGTPELYGERQDKDARLWYVARPIKISNAQCLVCHSDPAIAPVTMINTYGSAGGFGWKLNEIVGAQVVTVPMDVPLTQARHAFNTFALTMGGMFVAVLVTLNLMLDRLIVRPLAQVAHATNNLSLGKFGESEMEESGNDEVADLRRAFNRMRRSMIAAIALAKKGR
jgi:protein-histidine pros-kinase